MSSASIRVPAGTTMAQLQKTTGLGLDALQQLVPDKKVKNGTVKSGFDLLPPEGYERSSGQRNVAQAMAESPTTGTSAVNLRTQADTASRPSATQVAKRLDNAMRDWTRVGARARAVFKTPSNDVDLDEARAVFTQLMDFVGDFVSLMDRAQTAGARARTGGKPKRALNEASRRAPHVLFAAIKDVMNAAPRLLGVYSTPDDYYSKFQDLARVVTDEPENRARAMNGLQDLFREVVATSQTTAIANEVFGERVQSKLQELRDIRRPLYSSVIGVAKASHGPNPRDIELGDELWAGLKSIVANMDQVRESSKPLIEELEAAGPGASRLLDQLSNDSYQASDALVHFGVEEVMNALPSIYRAHGTERLMDRDRSQLAKDITTGTPQKRKAAMRKLGAYVKALRTEATNNQTATNKFAARVDEAKGEIRAKVAEWKAAVTPFIHAGSTHTRARSYEVADSMWTAAKKVRQQAFQLRKGYQQLLDDLSETPGADAMYRDLDDHISRAELYGPAGLIADAISSVPQVLDLTFSPYLHESERNELARNACNPAVDKSVRAQAMRTLSARYSSLVGDAKAIDAAEATFRSKVNAYADEVAATLTEFDKVLQEAKATGTASVADYARANRWWSALNQGLTNCEAIASRGHKLLDEVKAHGNGTTKLEIAMKNALASAEGGPGGRFVQVFKALPGVLDLGSWYDIERWSEFDAGRALNDPASRATQLAEFKRLFDKAVGQAKTRDTVRERHGQSVDAMKDQIGAHTKSTGQWARELAESSDSPRAKFEQILEQLETTDRLAQSRDALVAQLESYGDGAKRFINAIGTDVHQRVSGALFKLIDHLPSLTQNKVTYEKRSELKQLMYKGDAQSLERVKAELQQLL